MIEGDLKGPLVERMRDQLKGYTIFRHEDRRTSGIPDISTTGNRRTSWGEVKHADPNFECDGLQELTMQRLEVYSFAAYYIIYDEAKYRGKRTLIVDPIDIDRWQELRVGRWCTGFNHQFVVDFIRKVHTS